MPFQQRQPRFVAVEADFKQRAVAAEHGGGKAGVEPQRSARFGRLAGVEMDQRPPLVQQPLHQDFEPPAAGLVAEQPGRNYPGIVEHQQIAGTQQIWQVAEQAVAKLAGGAGQGQQPAVAAPGRRMLGN